MDNINFDFQKNKAGTKGGQQKQEGTAEKGSFSQEYSEVINSAISADNIYTFHDDAIEKLIKIIEKIVNEYKNSHPDTQLSGKELEDEALKEERLQDIPSMLDVISKRKIDLRNIEDLIKSKVIKLPEVLVPPGEGGIIPGPGESFSEKELIPRLIMLLYVLENDLTFDLQDNKAIQIVEGLVTDEMMRKHPYFRVSILPFERVVFVCEEKENATYVFDKEELDRLGIQAEELDITNKATFSKLIEEQPKIGTRIIYSSKSWRAKILGALTEEFGQKEEEIVKQKSDFELKEVVPKKKEGWESASSLVKGEFCETGMPTIEEYAEHFREKHPEWFELQRVSNGATAEHYDPELIKKILERFPKENISNKKSGWESASSLRETCKGAEYDTIKNYAEQFREKNKSWFEFQKANNGKKAEHYDPKLVDKIIEHFVAVPQKKEDWMSKRVLAELYGISRDKIEEYAEQSREEHPEWFEDQKTRSITTEHYGPKLVDMIVEHFISIPKKRDGWESASSLQETYGHYRKKFKDYAEQFRSGNPKWFETQKSSGNIAEYYDPTLVKIIIEHFKK